MIYSIQLFFFFHYKIGEEVVELQHYETKLYQVMQLLDAAKKQVNDGELFASRLTDEMRRYQSLQTEAKNQRLKN